MRVQEITVRHSAEERMNATASWLSHDISFVRAASYGLYYIHHVRAHRAQRRLLGDAIYDYVTYFHSMDMPPDALARQNIRIKNNFLQMLFEIRVHVFSNIHSWHLLMALNVCLFNGTMAVMRSY